MLIVLTWLSLIVFMSLVWLFYLKNKNPGIIDVAWGLAICIAGLLYLNSGKLASTQVLAALLLIIWALRLSGYLYFTRIRTKHIEKRYVKLSESWKNTYQLGFLINYQFQGFLAVLIAAPFLFIRHVEHLSTFSIIGLLIVLTGIIGESIADKQLYNFRKLKTGKVCNVGLWKYSRHPNYFFEFLVWLGFAVSALAVQWGWLALISPGLLLYVMLCITGPITEKGSIESKGDLYLAYQRKTSMFVLLPPRD